MPARDDVEAKPPCHPRACAIQGMNSSSVTAMQLTCQDCLTKNNYNEAKCQNAVKALYACCDAFYERYGDDASSPSCPKPSLLRLKMKQLNQSK